MEERGGGGNRIKCSASLRLRVLRVGGCDRVTGSSRWNHVGRWEEGPRADVAGGEIEDKVAVCNWILFWRFGVNLDISCPCVW